MRISHKNYRFFYYFLMATMFLTLLAGCGKLPQPDSPFSNPSDSRSELSTSSTSDYDGGYQLFAKEANVLSVACGENARIDISLPAGVFGSDKLLELIPLEGGDLLVPGFSLNEKGGSNLTLQAPAGICYVTTGDLPENACIVKYSHDNQYTKPVPTHRFQWGKTSGLVAFVNEFSSYGVRVVTKAELEEMADELEDKGFHWRLLIEDKDGFNETNSDEWITGETNYQASLDMVLFNIDAPSPYVMHGQYRGAAKMVSDVKVTMEGAPMFFSIVEATDDNASLTLYPVFQEYEPEPASGLPPLSGLIPIRYEGKGTLHMKDPIDLGPEMSEHGINLMTVAREFEQSGIDLPGLQEENLPVTIVTEGPIAYVTLALKEGRSLTFTGSIVGRSADQKIEIVPLVPESGKENKQVEKSETTCIENPDGSFDYDMDGDGIIDFTLYPLIYK